ncbi:MAG: adenosylcobinamide-GDP ribazoletransferase [Chloroflexota bacterium]
MQRLGGGITGDVYGALCEICEVLCLLGGVLWVSN